jgi:hypothetical protein
MNRDTEDDQKCKIARDIAFPIVFVDGKSAYSMNNPMMDCAQKQRSWWITGPVNWGKTRWLRDVLYGTKCFLVLHNDESRWDNYEHEQIIVFDDVVPTRRGDLAMLEQCIFTSQRTPGNTKRNLGDNVSFIVLSKLTIEEAYANLKNEWDFIKARFIEIICQGSECNRDTYACMMKSAKQKLLRFLQYEQ